MKKNNNKIEEYLIKNYSNRLTYMKVINYGYLKECYGFWKGYGSALSIIIILIIIFWIMSR